MSEQTRAVAKTGSKAAVNTSSQESVLQRAAVNADSVNDIPPAVYDVLHMPGQPLDEETRGFMESRFGHDFSSVRVHTDGRAGASARSVNAQAYTIGQEIVFGQSQYEPATEHGRRLLAHELTHVIQQRGLTLSNSELIIAPTNSIYENEPSQIADHMISKSGTVDQHRNSNVAVSHSVQANYLHRQPTSPPSGSAGGGAPPRRIIYVDANVFDQINRNNQVAANTLKQMTSSGADVRVSQFTYDELVTKPAIPRTATANRLMIEELHIKRVPLPTLSERVDTGLANQRSGGQTVVSPQDAQVLAGAKAGEGELWSFDAAFRNDPGSIKKRFGVEVAPESAIPLASQGAQADYRVGRRLMGLEPVEISLTGVIKRGGPPSAGNSTGGSPAPETPQAKAGATPEEPPPQVGSVGKGNAPASDVSKGSIERPDVSSPKSGQLGVKPSTTVHEEPSAVPVPKASIGREVLKSAGATGFMIGLSLLQSWLMSKLNQSIYQNEKQKMELEIQNRLNALLEKAADIQSGSPSMPIYANITIQAVEFHHHETEDRPVVVDYTMFGYMSLVSVDVSHQKIESPPSKSSKWDFWHTLEIINVIETYSVQLQPLSREQLRQFILTRLANVEADVSVRTSTQEGLQSSNKERNTLYERLRNLDRP
jgi:Domain of unknown function (DUF4157)